MARSFILLCLLKEAYSIDLNNSRMQASKIRDSKLFNNHKDFVKNYRLSEELVDQLLEDIKHFLKTPNRQRIALSIKVKVLCTLSFFATGSYRKICRQITHRFVSQPSVSRCLREVVNALTQPSVVEKYIRFPQNSEEILKLKEKFLKKYNIPDVIGCINGTYVTIIRPSENEEHYFCSKGYHAVKVQLIIDADLNILHVDATYGAATHESAIFNNSPIHNQLEGLVDVGEKVHLLGNSEYTQSSYMMVPVPNTVEGTPEEHYNKLHAKAYKTVERAITRLKGRFRCLLVQNMLHYHPDMVAKIVLSCCILHNICNRARLPVPRIDECSMRKEISFHDAMRMKHSNAQSSRRDLIHRLWSSLNIDIH